MRLLTALVLLSITAAGQTPTWTMARLPGTGQSRRFGTQFGEDSDYNGTHPPNLRAAGDGTVADLVTGLLWQQGDGGEMTIERARLYCSSLSLGGYTDWRLPFAHESYSILNHGQARPPALDTKAFTQTPAEYWWTADVRADDASRIWVTNAGGGIGPHPRDETRSAGGEKLIHTRCVRTGINVKRLVPALRANGDGTVTDLNNGLVWQQQLSDPMSWEEAIAWAERLEAAGHSDWRLPNVKELQSINDESVTAPSLSRSAFPGAPAAESWSSTTLYNRPERAWTVDFTLGIASYRDKTDKLRVRCVRGGLREAASVSAASFEARVAPGSLATTFGEDLPQQPTLRLTDASGTQWQASVLASSPNQVNFLVPEASLPGLGSVTVLQDDSLVAAGVVDIAAVSPSLFSASGNGKGVALVLAENAAGSTPAYRCEEAEGCQPLPLTITDDLRLVLFGTGLRNASAAESSIGGVGVSVAALTPAADLPGIDRITLGPLPASLTGRGDVTVLVTANSFRSNPVTIRIQ